MNNDRNFAQYKIKIVYRKKMLREKEYTRCHLTNSVEMLCMRAVNMRETVRISFHSAVGFFSLIVSLIVSLSLVVFLSGSVSV